MTKDKALTLALEALNRGESQLRWEAIAAIEEVLAQPGQEPFGYVWLDTANFRKKIPPTGESEAWNAVYTTPPKRPPEQEPVAHWSDCAVHSEPAYPKGECDCGGFPPKREWVGLTDAEAQLIYDMGRTPSGMMEMVEAKLKEKNNG